jgi:hypothetical protein
MMRRIGLGKLRERAGSRLGRRRSRSDRLLRGDLGLSRQSGC